jgi:hypothetical protein
MVGCTCLVVKPLTEMKTIVLTDQTNRLYQASARCRNDILTCPLLHAIFSLRSSAFSKSPHRRNVFQQRHQGATVSSPILDRKSFVAALMSRGNEMFQATEDLYARSAEPIVSRHGSSKGLGV